MFKSLLTNFIIGALLNAFVPALPTYGDTKANQDAQRTTQIKERLAQLGTGREAKVQLKLRDQRKLTGYIAGLEAETFSVRDSATNVTTNVRYDEVAYNLVFIDKNGGKLSRKFIKTK